MHRVWGELLWRVPLLVWLCWGLWEAWGAIGLVMASAPIALGLARPLQDLFSASAGQLAHLATTDALQGTRHFRGHALGVIEDREHRLWLRVDDLVRAVEGLSATRLQGACGEGFSPPSWQGPAHVEAQALIDVLAAAEGRPTRRFVAWLREELAADERRRRRRLVRVRR